jgi:hypothetical protein
MAYHSWPARGCGLTDYRHDTQHDSIQVGLQNLHCKLAATHTEPSTAQDAAWLQMVRFRLRQSPVHDSCALLWRHLTCRRDQQVQKELQEQAKRFEVYKVWVGTGSLGESAGAQAPSRYTQHG